MEHILPPPARCRLVPCLPIGALLATLAVLLPVAAAAQILPPRQVDHLTITSDELAG